MLCQLQKTYLEAEVLTASPVRLIEILFDLGMSTIENARACCRNEDIVGRGQRLYDYCQRRLLEAHIKQSEPMLEEVQSLLGELREAWQAVVATCTPRCLTDEEVLAEQLLVTSNESRISCVG
jgi:flagellar protein FliS